MFPVTGWFFNYCSYCIIIWHYDYNCNFTCSYLYHNYNNVISSTVILLNCNFMQNIKKLFRLCSHLFIIYMSLFKVYSIEPIQYYYAVELFKIYSCISPVIPFNNYDNLLTYVKYTPLLHINVADVSV